MVSSQKITDIESLRNATRALPELHPKHKWDEHRLALRNHILKEDPQEFIKWSTVQATMFVGNNSHTHAEYKEMKSSKKLNEFLDYQASIHENWIGKPPPFDLNKEASGNTIHQAYHLFKFINMLSSIGVRNELGSVAEIGGGYGTMCWIMKRMKSKREYHLFDHPEFLMLQEYYLNRSGVAESTYFHDKPQKIEVDVFIAISSLSEMPVKLREDYLQHIQAKYYLISYQNEYFNVDNDKFFREYFKDFNALVIKPHPYLEIHNYLVAIR